MTIPDAVLPTSPNLSPPKNGRRCAGTSVTGAALLAGVRMLRQIVPLVRHHHERFDGKGYPDGSRAMTSRASPGSSP